MYLDVSLWKARLSSQSYARPRPGLESRPQFARGSTGNESQNCRDKAFSLDVTVRHKFMDLPCSNEA